MEGEWVWEIEPVQGKDVEFLKMQTFAFSEHECALAYVLCQNFLKKLRNQTRLTDVQVPAHATTQLGQPRMLHPRHQLWSEFHTENQHIITSLGLLI